MFRWILHKCVKSRNIIHNYYAFIKEGFVFSATKRSTSILKLIFICNMFVTTDPDVFLTVHNRYNI